MQIVLQYFFYYSDFSAMSRTRDERILEKFGLRLKSIREEKGISLRKLEQLSEIDFSQIHRIEKGQTNPSLTTLHALSNALGVDICTLLKS